MRRYNKPYLVQICAGSHVLGNDKMADMYWVEGTKEKTYFHTDMINLGVPLALRSRNDLRLCTLGSLPYARAIAWYLWYQPSQAKACSAVLRAAHATNTEYTEVKGKG